MQLLGLVFKFECLPPMLRVEEGVARGGHADLLARRLWGMAGAEDLVACPGGLEAKGLGRTGREG